MRSNTRLASLGRLIALSAALVAASLSFPASAADNPQQPASRKTTQSETYIVVEPIYSTILDGNKPLGLLMVELGLDVPDAALRGRVTQALPALRDAYVRNLLNYAATAVRPTRQPNVEEIANRMQAVTDKMVGHEGARVLMAQTAIRLTR